MSELLPPIPLFAAFFAASFVLAVTPGPGVMYIVARSLANGRRSGLASVGGVALGNMSNAMGAALGLGALFAVSSDAFLSVKYAGAIYLVYIGIRALTYSRRATERVSVEGPHTSRVFRDGFIVALLNPKTALFFAAFLPQFMTADGPLFAQTLVLSALFVGIAVVTDAAYALLAGAASSVVRRSPGAALLCRCGAGGTLIGLGLFTAFAGVRGTNA